MGAKPRPSRQTRFIITVADIEQADRIIENSGVLDQLAQWRDEDKGKKSKLNTGGRPAVFDDRIVLVLFILLTILHRPLHFTEAANLLNCYGKDSKIMKALGLPTEWMLRKRGKSYSTQKEFENVHKRLHAAYKRLVAPMDPYPEIKNNRRADLLDYYEIVKQRDPELVATRRARINEFASRLAVASAMEIREEAISTYQGDVSVDGTEIKACRIGNPRENHPRAHLLKASSHPDAGWYRPKDDHKGNGGPDQNWAYEATLAVAVPSNPGPYGIPTLICGLAIELPGHAPGLNAQRAVRYALDTFLLNKRGFMIGDRAYFAVARPENFHRPMREMGFKVIGDYKENNRGKQAEFHGAIMVDGDWYGPCMPQRLIDASALRREGKISEQEYDKLIAQRETYRLRPKCKKNKAVSYICPARGASTTVSCPLVEGSSDARPDLLTVLPSPAVRRAPGKICTNGCSLTIPDAEGERFRQDELVFGSREHRRIYALCRNAIESTNAHMKTMEGENAGCAIGSTSNRPVRGYASTAVMIALGAVSSNLGKISAYHNRIELDQIDGTDPFDPRFDPLSDESVSDFSSGDGDDFLQNSDQEVA